MPMMLRVMGSYIVPPGGEVPVGTIVMWEGTSAPSGWSFCDGSGGTPDLRNKFVVGAGSTYSVGATGGEDTNSLSAHSHTGAASHAHSASGSVAAGAAASINTGTGTNMAASTHTHSASVSLASGSTSSGNNSVGLSMDNRPPYYTVAFIVKV